MALREVDPVRKGPRGGKRYIRHQAPLNKGPVPVVMGPPRRGKPPLPKEPIKPPKMSAKSMMGIGLGLGVAAAVAMNRRGEGASSGRKSAYRY
mgnify:CR=1 FL=1